MITENNNSIELALKFFQSHLKTSYSKQIQHILPIELMAKQFNTVTIKHQNKNIILAIPISLKNFYQKKSKIIEQYYENPQLQKHLSDVDTLNDRVFQIIAIEISAITKENLLELHKQLKIGKYLPQTAEIKYSYILIITAKYQGYEYDEQKNTLQIAIPIREIFQASEISSDEEILEIQKFLNILNEIQFQKLDEKIQYLKLAKLEYFYNQIINLKKSIQKDKTKYLIKKNIKYNSDDIINIKKQIEKIFIKLYAPQAAYLLKLEKIISQIQ